MKRPQNFRWLRFITPALWLFSAAALSGQSASFLTVSPQSATLLKGESRSFRLVDQRGRMQREVTWTISDPDALKSYGGSDELTINAKQVGDFRISGQSKNGSAEATVTVTEGPLPVGTAIWSSGAVAGCKTIQLVQAMPSLNGPDMYQTSHCPDGDYITAFTSDGIQMWRRRVGESSAITAAPESKDAAVGSAGMNLGAASVCDVVSVGMDRQKIHELLEQRNLSFSPGPVAERLWVVDESNRQCKLWFDDKWLLARKRKIFIAE